MAIIKPQNQKPDYEFEVKNLLASFGFNEVHSHIWSDNKGNENLGIITPSYLKTINSLNVDNTGLRSELYPSLINFASNLTRQNDEIAIFEIGRVINKNKEEEKRLSIILTSKNDEEKDFFEMKEIITSIFSNVLGGDVKFALKQFSDEEAKQTNFHIKNTFDIVYDDLTKNIENEKISGKNSNNNSNNNNNIIGTFALANPKIKKAIVGKKSLVIAEINFSIFETLSPKLNLPKALSKFQSSEMDWTFNVSKSTLYAELENAILEFKNSNNKTETSNNKEKSQISNNELGGLIQSINFIDSFEKGDINAITIRLKIGSDNKTLTDEELTTFHKAFTGFMVGKKFLVQ
jgi:phenylalanyl-tRNA synthetase beta chain